jgi:hypothetical protein
MSSKNVCATLVACALSLGPASVAAGPITLVDPGTLSTNALIDFEELVLTDLVLGTIELGNVDALLTSGGATFAESFAGQSVDYSTDFDALSADQNLVPGRDTSVTGSTVLSGLGSQGFSSTDLSQLDHATGEGSIAMIFDQDQSQLFFDLGGWESTAGNAYINFYRRDGSLIDALVLTSLTDIASFGFLLGTTEIAGFSFYNDDGGGLFIDNIGYTSTAASVPEPATLFLFGAGLAITGARLRRSRS